MSDTTEELTRQVVAVLAACTYEKQRADLFEARLAAARDDAYCDAAGDLETDATRLATSDPRAAEVLTGAAYLLRTRADSIAAAIPPAPTPHLPACARSGPNPGTLLCICPPRPCTRCGRLCDDPDGSA